MNSEIYMGYEIQAVTVRLGWNRRLDAPNMVRRYEVKLECVQRFRTLKIAYDAIEKHVKGELLRLRESTPSGRRYRPSQDAPLSSEDVRDGATGLIKSALDGAPMPMDGIHSDVGFKACYWPVRV